LLQDSKLDLHALSHHPSGDGALRSVRRKASGEVALAHLQHALETGGTNCTSVGIFDHLALDLHRSLLELAVGLGVAGVMPAAVSKAAMRMPSAGTATSCSGRLRGVALAGD
jgi:hypothetical protein